jgi:hypothetical protein
MPSQALLCVFGWQISGGLDINSEQPSEKKNRIRHSPFVDARLPYSLDFSFFSILLFSRFQQAAACHPERGTFLIYCI